MTFPDTLLAAGGRDWIGNNTFRLLPADPPSDAHAGATISAYAGSNVGVLGYIWIHPDDGPQDGVIVVGRGEADAECSVLWADSWHQPSARSFAAVPVDGAALRFSYEYADGWHWEVELTVVADAITLVMRNVVPEDNADGMTPGPYDAMAMRLEVG